MCDWSPVIWQPLIYSFLININKSLTMVTHMLKALVLSGLLPPLFFFFFFPILKSFLEVLQLQHPTPGSPYLKPFGVSSALHFNAIFKAVELKHVPGLPSPTVFFFLYYKIFNKSAFSFSAWTYFLRRTCIFYLFPHSVVPLYLLDLWICKILIQSHYFCASHKMSYVVFLCKELCRWLIKYLKIVIISIIHVRIMVS